MSDVISTKTTRLCEFPGCGRHLKSRHYCEVHWNQKRAGKELKTIRHRRPDGSPPVIEYDESPCPKPELKGPCHIFRFGKHEPDGYGKTSSCGKQIFVHRYVWERDVGPIPDGMEIDHQCQVRGCCNVDHLRVVTRMVNATENIDGCAWQVMAAKTHCPKGHPYDETNTYRYPNGRRTCRICDATAKKAYKRRLREKRGVSASSQPD